MSYILDALRKAERERNLGQTPDLRSAPAASPSTRRPIITKTQRRLAGIAVIALCIGLALWLRAPRTNTAAVATEPAAPVVTTAPTPAVEAPPPAPTESGPAQLDDLLDPETPKKSLPIEEQRRLSTAAAPQPAPAKTAPASTPTPVETPAEPEKPTMAEQAASEPELPPEIKPLKQMNPDYRGNFPKIRIDVHAYDEDPARRFVMINGRKYREGETITEGPSITAIESDGVVFNYNNQEVLVPVGR